MRVYQFLLNKGLERRRSQEEFFSIVEETYEEGGVSIVEAPTGTGKTFGYLIPVFEKGYKAIISTGTKLLQEQLRRDIEEIRSAYSYLYGKDVSYLVVKGKANYLCLDRFYKRDDVPFEIRQLVEGEWDGDFERVHVDPHLQLELCVDDDYCTKAYRRVCPHLRDCYYYTKLKRKEASAQILVVNHALLSLKDFEDSKERMLVVDEAHELDKYYINSLSGGISLYFLRVHVLGSIRQFLHSADVDVEGFFERNFSNMFRDDREKVSLDTLRPYAEGLRTSILEPILTGSK